jgi:hypothetical protein
MNQVIIPDWMAPYRWWSGAINRVALAQCQWLEAQYRAGARIMNVLLPRTEGTAADADPGPLAVAPAPPGEPENLARRAEQRLGQGLAPPREIYEVHNRGLVDWSELPAWARPSDPELFDGCSHEG